eukprot:5497403-Amphidinium_carterae.4
MAVVSCDTPQGSALFLLVRQLSSLRPEGHTHLWVTVSGDKRPLTFQTPGPGVPSDVGSVVFRQAYWFTGLHGRGWGSLCTKLLQQHTL